jgi:hypothetical protein
MSEDDFRELHHFETEKAMVEALAHLRIAEGADFDILNGRNVIDAAEERAAAIRMAIGVLEEATTQPTVQDHTNGSTR